MDDDDNDNEDKFVVNKQLTDAVEALYPGAKIVDAEIENNQIEVEAIVMVGTQSKEIELVFDMNYVLVGSEVEYETTYGELTDDFSAVNAWFADTANNFPIPAASTIVEITQGNLIEDNFTPNLNYKYGVEIEYQVGQIEYEVMFYLDAEYAIIKIESEID